MSSSRAMDLSDLSHWSSVWVRMINSALWVFERSILDDRASQSAVTVLGQCARSDTLTTKGAEMNQ